MHERSHSQWGSAIAHEAKYIELSELDGVAAWMRVLQEVRTTGTAAILRDDGDDIAVIAPVKQTARRSPHSPAPGSRDLLWEIVGMIEDEDGPTDASSNKHAYLADAYTPKPR